MTLSDTPSLAMYAKYMLEPAPLLFLTNLLLHLASFYNVKGNLTDKQARNIAIDILDHKIYSRYRLDDFVYFSKLFRSGDLVKIFQNVDHSKIFEGLKEYDKQRFKFFQNLEEVRYIEQKKREQDAFNINSISAQEYKKRIQKLVKNKKV